MSEDKSEIEADRIRRGLCPACGEKAKDKGSYIRCTKCNWCLTDGTWNDEGFVIDREVR
jgi:ribosomal protein L37AE/L43A